MVLGTDGDIQFSFQFMGENVDNLHCMSNGNGQYFITLNPSAINDTVKIIYNGYSQMDTVINTTGASPFDVGASWTNAGMLFTSSQGYSGLYDFFHNVNKIISGGDTLVVENLIANYPASYPGCFYSTVNGDLFIDNNSDCIYNTGDNGITASVQYMVNYTNGQVSNSIYADINGHFSDTLFKSDGFIDATFTVPSIYNFAYTIPLCAQAMYNVTTLPATGLNFARECTADVDVRASLAGVWPGARPLIPFNLFPNVSNVGCQPTSGVLELVLDPNVTYDAVNSSHPADNVSGNSLFWNYSNLTNVGLSNTGYWNEFWGGVQLTPNASVNIGDVLTFTVNATVPGNDAIPANNSYTITIPVVNSYDPNIKHVEPAGVGTEGFIPATTTKLTYTVQFQNTGTADAIVVNIIDTLEANVLPRTFKIVDASHQMSPTWLSNNVVKFNFDQIHLPDSTTNEPASHGFVTFEVEMLQGLTPGTEIKNTAYIYFDANPAIVTNTVKNTIEFPGQASITENNANGLGVLVYPNPMTESTTFSIQDELAKDVTLKLYDMTGKLINTIESQGASKIIINKNQLEKGIYIYQIQDNSTQFNTTGRLVVQ